MTGDVRETSDLNSSSPPDLGGRSQALVYFIFAVLGFSFWFSMAVPFASHRESYSWLAGVHTQSLAQQFAFGLSSTYRPLAQVVTWVGFLILGPNDFPTSVLRQALLQCFIYGLFVLAWWLVYSKAPQRRLFSLVAFVAGSVFFSGYIQLFHIYGMFYVPVVMTLGTLLYLYGSKSFEKRELTFAIVATVLVFWHPFATALFVGFYSGFYLDTFWKRSRSQHVQAIAILLVGSSAILALVALFPRAHMPSDSRLFGFLVSYETNEVNRVASFVAFLLAQMVVFSTDLSRRLKLASAAVVTAMSILFVLKGLPVLFIWFGCALLKSLRLRSWSLFSLMLTAVLLPFGGGIGSPMYVLFAIVVAVYVTPLGWLKGERALSFAKPRYIGAATIVFATVVLVVRAGISVPLVTRAARPLLAERERTYQLEDTLAWLHDSDYCGCEISYMEDAGSPVADVESALKRQHRPPSAIEDVRLFWNSVLRCPRTERTGHERGTVTLTFGGQLMPDSKPVFKIKGIYGGDTTVWVRNSQYNAQSDLAPVNKSY